MSEHSGDTGAQVRIISETSPQEKLRQFAKDCYRAWRNGCECVGCRVVDKFEGNRINQAAFEFQMEVAAVMCHYDHSAIMSLSRRDRERVPRGMFFCHGCGREHVGGGCPS